MSVKHVIKAVKHVSRPHTCRTSARAADKSEYVYGKQCAR
jgi:hypothetical protein